MSEKLIVALSADINDLTAKLKEAQTKLQQFGNGVNGELKTITFDVLETQLSALNAELRQTAIGTERFKELGAQIVKTETQINNAFQSIASKGTRGFNGLNNSINQITRELPAFGLSANIGFLAISNNLPILIDEINRLKIANQQLVAEGKPVQSVFKSIGAAIFSYQTALSVGVTLMTIYGGKIIEMIQGVNSGVSQFDLLTGKVDALNKAYESTSVDKQLAEYIKLIGALDQVNKGIVNQKDFLDKYNSVVEGVTKSANSFSEAENNIINNTDAYVNAIIARAAAEEVAKEAAVTLKKLNEAKLKNESDFVSNWQDFRDGVAMGTKNSDRELLALEQERIARNKKLKDDEINSLKSNYQKQLALYKTFQQDFVSITNKIENEKAKGGDKKKQIIEPNFAAGGFKLPELDALEQIDISSLAPTEESINAFTRFNAELQKAIEYGLPYKGTITSTKEQLVELNTNAMALVNTLGGALTSAFDAALISGENFGTVLLKAIGDLIKKMLAAVATAAILSAILSSFGIGAVALGGASGSSLFGTIIKGLTGFGGTGANTSNRVASPVVSQGLSGNVAFEIRGDKLYGVLQNYQGRLDRLA